MSLTDQEKNVKVAEVCGYVNRPRQYDYCGDSGIVDIWVRFNNDGTINQGVPDYGNDLNAMHEAEKILDEASGCQAQYIYELKETCRLNAGRSYRQDWHCPHATASQRREAFAKVRGLW